MAEHKLHIRLVEGRMSEHELRIRLIEHQKCKGNEHEWCAFASVEDEITKIVVQRCAMCSLKRGRVFKRNRAVVSYIYDDVEVDYSEVATWF